LIGPFYRAGTTYNTSPIQVYDHDWPSWADGVAIPHGIYDITQNKGYIQLGTSRDTTEFACDCLFTWWKTYGQYLYPTATSLLVLCDGGGSNGSRFHIFKQDLQQLADDLTLEIRIAHYPPYTSKYNPIEHRLFPHLSRVCQGIAFESVEMVRDLMATASTQTGLEVFTSIIDAVYETGRKASTAFIDNMPIVFDELLPAWNYVAQPQQQ